jgi:hypothetical protein
MCIMLRITGFLDSVPDLHILKYIKDHIILDSEPVTIIK